MPYAERTKVPEAQTRNEIERLVLKHAGDNFVVMNGRERAMVGFEMNGRRILFRLPLDPNAGDQVRRSRWRALMLTIKAKLESIEAGIETFEDAFLAHIMMPGGQTVGEQVRPGIERAYRSGSDVPLLPAPGCDR